MEVAEFFKGPAVIDRKDEQEACRYTMSYLNISTETKKTDLHHHACNALA